MNLKDFKSAAQVGKGEGAKILLYGPPGSAKTPMCAAIPNAAMAAIEKGMAGVKQSTTPTAECHTLEAYKDFHKWCLGSKEAQQFETYILDSLTRLADLALEDALRKNKDGRAAYGEMGTYIMDVVHSLSRLPGKNVIFISQMATEHLILPGQPAYLEAKELKTTTYNRPLFPGQKLSRAIPHAIGEILYSHFCQTPDGVYALAISTIETPTSMGRSRCGNLGPLERPNMSDLLIKINS